MTKQKNGGDLWQIYFKNNKEIPNIIEANHQAVSAEIETFRQKYPRLSSIDVLFPGYSGHLRGKRIAIHDVKSLAAGDVHIPISISLLDFAGANCTFLPQGNEDADPDCLWEPIAGTMNIVPWANEYIDNGKGEISLGGQRAQILGRHTMPDGTPAPGDPRHVLAKQIASFAELGLRPAMALEFEFYLCRMALDKEGRPQMASYSKSGHPPIDIHCNDMTDMDSFDAVLSEMTATLKAQGMDALCATKEYSPGQYEINLPYDTDVMRLCDQALLYRRVIKAVAKKHGLNATFMAKPFAGFAGSGLHVHISLFDEQGNNIFEKGLDEKGRPLVNDQLLHTIGGAMKHTKDLMVLLCPTSNSYRRFMLYGAYAPINSSWNIDDRSVAFRIPLSNAKNTRLEYRIAGSDANPYFVCAALLAAVKDGLENKIVPPAKAKVEQGRGMDNKPDFPFYWYQAIENFHQSAFAKKAFGEEHHERLYKFHLSEFHSFHSFQSRLDITRYFFHL
ncbi:MAG: glutamine synthetase family protein [Hydrotalea sp.]|nr:glutamine synthetase family protein [Hydrotalea sp.]